MKNLISNLLLLLTVATLISCDDKTADITPIDYYIEIKALCDVPGDYQKCVRIIFESEYPAKLHLEGSELPTNVALVGYDVTIDTTYQNIKGERYFDSYMNIPAGKRDTILVSLLPFDGDFFGKWFSKVQFENMRYWPLYGKCN